MKPVASRGSRSFKRPNIRLLGSVFHDTTDSQNNPVRKFKSLFLIVAFLAFITNSSHAQMRKIVAELSPMVETDAVHPGTTVRAAMAVKLPETYHMQSDKPSRPLLVPTHLQLDVPKGVEVVELVYPQTIELTQDGIDGTLAVFEREYTIGIQLKIGSDVLPGDLVIPVLLGYQPCDDSMCYPPTKVTSSWTIKVAPAATVLSAQNAEVIGKIAYGSGKAPEVAVPVPLAPDAAPPAAPDSALALLDGFTVIGNAGGYLRSGEFLKFIRNSETGVKEVGMFEGHGPLAIVLIVLLGGFALNLTPCVLPMIPINLAIIGAGAQAGSAKRGLLLGATYGAAMAMVYGVIGLVVILTAGTFGTLNASPWFNLGIALLFIVLGLAMFDVFRIDLSRFSGKFNSGAKTGSFMLAFSMGAVAALLAGACVAPVVIQVVLFASNLYNTGTKVALALPFFLGLGMALPWPFAGAGLSALPKPGAWMTRVKQGFGVLIIGTSLYYGYLAYEIFSAHPADAAESGKLDEGWYGSLEEGLKVAQRENKPVIIDLWASWCKNCLTMDQTTFKDAGVIKALDGYVKIKFPAEKPEEEPAKSVIQRFKAVGLPSYIILKPANP